MSRNASESAVDRLIAMAESGTPGETRRTPALPDGGAHDPDSMPMLPDPARGTDENAMLKALLQFRMMMPYMSRLMEPQGQADPGIAALASELKQSVGDLQLTQRDLRMTVQEQLVQMKRVEEEMNKIGKATDKNAFETTDLVEDMKSMHSLVRKTAGTLGAMLAVLIGLVVYFLLRNPVLH